LSFLAGAIVGKIVLDSSQWTGPQAQVQKETELLKKGMTGLKVAAAAVSVGITAAFVGMGKAAYDFEKGFANVTTVLGTSTIDVNKMKAELLGLDARLGSAADLTEGLYQALSASVEPTKAVQFVGEAAQFARAALTSTNTAVDVITTSLNAYGMSANYAGRVSDVLFKTIELGKVTGEQLAGSIGNSIPLAASMGVTFEELNAHMIVYTRQGINVAEATTRFNGILNEILKPSEDLSEAIKKIGFESGSTAIKTLGVHETLLRLIATTDGSQESLAKMFNNVRALQGVLASTGKGAADFNDILNTLQQSTGATNNAFEKQELTFETLKNSINKAFITLGQSFLPIVKDVVKVITDVTQWVANWDEGTKRLVLGIAAFVAVAIPMGAVITNIIKAYQILQPILLAIKAGLAFQAAAAGSSTIAIAANTIATNVQTIALKAQALAQGALNVIMMAAPYLLVAGGIALVVGAIVGWGSETKNTTKIQNELKETTEKLSALTKEFKENNDKLASSTGMLNEQERKTLEQRQSLLKNQIVATLKEEVDLTVKLTTATGKQQKEVDNTKQRYNEVAKILSNLQDLRKIDLQHGMQQSEVDQKWSSRIKEAESNLVGVSTKLAKQTAELEKSNLNRQDTIDQWAEMINGGYIEIGQIRMINKAIAEEVFNRAQVIKNKKEEKKETIIVKEETAKLVQTTEELAGVTGGLVETTETLIKDRTGLLDTYGQEQSLLQNSMAGIVGYGEAIEDIYVNLYETIEEERSAQAEKEKKDLEDKIALYKKTYDDIVGYATQVFSSINSLVSQLQENESTALENEYKKRKENIEANVTDEEEKAKQLEALEKEFADKRAALKKKEFVANQIAAAVNAAIATSNAVMNVLATPGLPPWISIPLSIVIGGLGAAEVAAILAQPVPEFAAGGSFDGGLAIVGERGPELVQFDQPGRVFSNQESRRMLGGDTINNFNIRQDIDYELAMRKLAYQQRKSARGRI